MDAHSLDWDTITDEVTQHLQALVRFNTTNPPGNETPAAEYVRDVLTAEGIEATLLESAPGRGNVVARLRGDGSARPLLLLSHLDVVPAEADEWEHDPFGGELIDGYVWGRGTVDTKQLTAMHMVVLMQLKRSGLPLRRDVILAATADEEVGGRYGLGWLLEEHPQLLDAEYALNEGGGVGIPVGKRYLYVCQTAEKGVCWLKVRARGQPGHGSTPTGDNAVVRLSEALARLGRASLPRHPVNTVAAFVKGLASLTPFPAGLMSLVLSSSLGPTLIRRATGNTMLAAVLQAMQRNTATPTVLRAGQKTNVIPAVAEAEVDGRLLPGQTPDDLLRELRPILGPDIEVEITGTSTPYETDYHSPLYELITQVLKEYDPEAIVVPFMLTGSTDGRFLAARGVKVYGFSPYRQEPGVSVFELAHGRNERISLENLRFGTRVLWDVVSRFVT